MGNGKGVKQLLVTVPVMCLCVCSCLLYEHSVETKAYEALDKSDINIYIDIDALEESNKQLALTEINAEELLLEANEVEVETVDVVDNNYVLDNSCIIVIEDSPKYMFTDIEDKVQYANTSVNLRYGPGDNFEVAHNIKLNTELSVTHEIDNGWSVVKYNDETLYCSTKLIQDKKVEVIQVTPFNESTEVMKFRGNVSTSCRNKAISLYNKLPNNVKNAMRGWGYEIIVSTSPDLTQGHCGMYYPMEMRSHKVAAVYAKSVGAVNIAVLHEVGHFVDNYLGNKEGRGYSPNYGFRALTSDPAWVEIYNQEVGKSGFPSYVTWCPEEFFAECFWKALAEPNWMKNTLPNAYNYIIGGIGRV